jgi:hypothetical protein
MFAHHLRWALPLACMLAAQVARAEIYTWVDASGTINVSNLTPPEGAHVTKVAQDSPPRVETTRDAAADAARHAELQALAERVRHLEYEAEFSRRQLQSVADYAASVAAPVPQYVVAAPQAAANDCDPTWMQCGAWWAPGVSPTIFVVASPSGFRRHPPLRGGHRIGMQTAVRAPGGFR